MLTELLDERRKIEEDIVEDGTASEGEVAIL